MSRPSPTLAAGPLADRLAALRNRFTAALKEVAFLDPSVVPGDPSLRAVADQIAAAMGVLGPLAAQLAEHLGDRAAADDIRDALADGRGPNEAENTDREDADGSRLPH